MAEDKGATKILSKIASKQVYFEYFYDSFIHLWEIESQDCVLGFSAGLVKLDKAYWSSSLGQ